MLRKAARAVHHMPPLLRLFAGASALILVVSLFAAQLAPYDPYATDPQLILQPPSAAHPCGTDNYGRDLLSRILFGARTSICAALLMRIVDIVQAFPSLILAIAVAGILGGGLTNAVLALMLTTWTQYARLARSMTLAAAEETYAQAARLSGCSSTRILFAHILPNIAGTLVTTAVMHISTMMMGLAALSYLGIGVKIPDAEWGAMISEGQKYLRQAPWAALAPSIVMIFVMMVFNLFGDALRDHLDPKMRK